MDDVTDAIKAIARSHISEETKASLLRLLSALVFLFVAPLFTFALRPMIDGDPSPFQFGMGIAVMALPETLALVWAVKVVRGEKHIWRKARRRRRGWSIWRVMKRLILLAVALGIPASIAATVWFF